MKARRPNNSSHGVTPRRATRSHHDRVVSDRRQKTEAQPQEILIATSASHTHSEFIAPARDEAATVGILPRLPAAVAAIISINSIPDIARRA